MILYKDLLNVSVKECGEKLVAFQKKILVREGCCARLCQVACELCVVCGYRHPEVQKRYFLEQLRLAKKRGFTGDELLEEVHKFIAVPEVAGHPTGGAVDVTLPGLDMGGAIADFSEPKRILTFSSVITEEQRENRLLLRSKMMQAGFAPFDGEWWHFSYGDREWAKFYGKPYAIYDRLAL